MPKPHISNHSETVVFFNVQSTNETFNNSKNTTFYIFSSLIIIVLNVLIYVIKFNGIRINKYMLILSFLFHSNLFFICSFNEICSRNE